MENQLAKERRELKISAGLIVGYIIAGFINMFLFDKTLKEAFGQSELVYGIVGIAISLIIIIRLNTSKNGKE